MLNKCWKMSVIIFITSLLISCGATPKNKLLGKWVDVGQTQSNDYMEFRSDNTVVMSTKEVPTLLEGAWTITDNGGVNVSFILPGSVPKSMDILYQFDEGKLTAIGPNGAKNSMVKL